MAASEPASAAVQSAGRGPGRRRRWAACTQGLVCSGVRLPPPASRPLGCLPSLRCGPPSRQPAPSRGLGSVAAFVHAAPWRSAGPGLGRQAVHGLLRAPRGLTPRPPPQTGARVWRDCHETCRGADAPACMQMVADVRRWGLWELRVAQGRTASCRACLSAGAPAQQADTVMAIHRPEDEVIGSGVATPLAVGMDTGESVQVGARHAGLLQNSWALSQGLHPTRQRLSTPSVMIPGHYR